MPTSKVFISYSHDSDEHKEWVYQLACRLVESGVEVVLDQWDIQLGSNILKFMEQNLMNSDRVLIVCTDNYNKKSNEGFGVLVIKKIFSLPNYFLLKTPLSLSRAYEE